MEPPLNIKSILLEQEKMTEYTKLVKPVHCFFKYDFMSFQTDESVEE